MTVWTDEDIEELRRLHAAGISDRDIAKQCGRSESSIRNKRYKLGIVSHRMHAPRTRLGKLDLTRVSTDVLLAELKRREANPGFAVYALIGGVKLWLIGESTWSFGEQLAMLFSTLKAALRVADVEAARNPGVSVNVAELGKDMNRWLMK